MGKKANKKPTKAETIADLIAGACDAIQLEAIVKSLEEMGAGCKGGSDPECDYVIKMLKAGYKNWTGEEL